MNPLLELKTMGQSVWLDYIQRDILKNDEVATMIEKDGLAGITSNPAIFEKAITGHDDYDEAQELDDACALPGRLHESGIDLNAVSEQLEAEGVQKFIDPFDKLVERLGQRR